ncbi:hypothetical protein B0H11DRAFT_2000797 [Mycena galericulata]|nr:hypothetical protein B0H11DRAFT_2000797 [Mycena galericulata]
MLTCQLVDFVACIVSEGTSMSLASASTIPGYVLRYRSHAMDGVYSIVAGLVLRIVVDAATFHNIKLSGTLVGLWEGVVLLHYVNKAPSSTDPYLAYGVRLFVDFLVTESVFKLVVVLLWSTMGMVLADVAPGVWADSGLKRQWSRFRRDLYRSARMFSKRRTMTVRFVSAPTIASTAPTIVSTASSVVSASTATAIPASPTAPPESVAPSPPILIRRRSSVPGTFPGAEWSETDTDAETAVDEPEARSIPAHVTIARIIPSSEDSYSFTTSPRSLSPTYSLDYSDDPSASNPVDIPSDVEDMRQTTPKQMVVVLPPTPSESLQDWDGDTSHREGEDVVPPSPWMPLIPDHEPLEEWETVEAPSPPPKDAALDVPDDDSSVAAPSTIAPEPPIVIPDPNPAPPRAMDEEPPMAMPIPHPATPPEDFLTPREPVVKEDPPPSFQDIYGSDPDLHALAANTAAATPEPEPKVDAPAADPVTASPEPKPEVDAAAAGPADTTASPEHDPAHSLRQALSLRKEALVITKRIAELSRKRKSSLTDKSSLSGAAVITALEIAQAEKELLEVNARAEGAFIGAYNPPGASQYELNTTGLTSEEAVRQTEARLGVLLRAPIPPPGTTPEDLAHDTPNRAALKVIMEQSIKGRVVKKALLEALNLNGMSWSEDTTRPNIVFVVLPVSAAADADSKSPADEPPEQKAEDEEEDAKEY